MALSDWILSAHALCAAFLAGLIWTIQLVHYPLFSIVGEDLERDGAQRFARYQRAHMARITIIVAPMMLAEAASAIALLALRPSAVPLWMPVVGAMLLLVVWASTAALQAPMHHRLARRFDPATVRRLVATNWIRTIAWSARAVLGMAMLFVAWSPAQP